MAVQLDLHNGETVVHEVKGDYWEKSFLCFYNQKTGKYWFTTERIIFKGGFATELEIPYSDIESIKSCAVGPFIPFMPTGIKVTLKNRGIYKLSILSRKKIMEIIESKM